MRRARPELVRSSAQYRCVCFAQHSRSPEPPNSVCGALSPFVCVLPALQRRHVFAFNGAPRSAFELSDTLAFLHAQHVRIALTFAAEEENATTDSCFLTAECESANDRAPRGEFALRFGKSARVAPGIVSRELILTRNDDATGDPLQNDDATD